MSTTEEGRFWMQYSYPKEFWLNLQGKTAFKHPTSPGYIRGQRIAAWTVVGIVVLLVLLALWMVH